MVGDLAPVHRYWVVVVSPLVLVPTLRSQVVVVPLHLA